MIVIVMGVAGSGKTTIGSLLAKELGWTFYDADDFHSEANRAKMSHGIPLTDEDRGEWLNTLRMLIQRYADETSSCVMACSALKNSYRELLSVSREVRFVYLKGSFDQIKQRLLDRTGHYMPVQLLKSQFDTLEEPQDALTIDISAEPEEIVQHIRQGFFP